MPYSTTVVDVGSSMSPLLAVLPQKSDNVIAIDIDHFSLLEASIRYPNIHFLESSASSLPLASNYCDTVLFLDVLEHVENEQQSIDEVWRILKPEGKLILSVPNRGLFAFLDPQNLSMRVRGTYEYRHRHRHYSEKDICRFFGSRFEILRRHYGGLFIYPLTFALNNFLQHHFGMRWGSFFKRVGDWDNTMSWGRHSYNLIIMARKVG